MKRAIGVDKIGRGKRGWQGDQRRKFNISTKCIFNSPVLSIIEWGSQTLLERAKPLQLDPFI